MVASCAFVYGVFMKKERFIVNDVEAGQRLAKLLPQRFPGHSRNYFQKIGLEDALLVNKKIVKSNVKLREKDVVEVNFPDAKELLIEARDIPLEIVFEDKNILVINKPAGLVVHPGTHGSHSDDSLVNAILHHCMGEDGKSTLGGISGTVRPGIVHRLDKDTSGLLVVAKNDEAQQFLMNQFQKKTVGKIYYALVAGHLEPKKGQIDAPIGRSLQDRKKMAVSQGKTSKEALTKYEVVRYFGGSLGDYTYVRVFLLTGRTHQIRVHFAAIGFPLVGDVTYGRSKINRKFEVQFGLKRQFLHAAKLAFEMPAGSKGPARSGGTKKGEFESTLPSDLQKVLNELAAGADQA